MVPIKLALLLLAILPSLRPAETVMAPMRDGVRLATDVYKPAGQDRAPVVLIRTPYNKEGARRDCTWFSEHGYVCIAQDVRGRFASEGEFYPFVNEGTDGFDAIEWAAAQPWSNGKVGTFGGSYLAWDQYHAAMYRPPHLEAMFALVGGAKFFDEYAYPGGTPNPGWSAWILNSARSSQQAARNPEAAGRIETILKTGIIDWLKLPIAERSKTLEGFPAHRKVHDDFRAHTQFDDYWKQKGFWTAGYTREIKDVPAFFVTGWYDYFGDGSIDTFRALAASQKTPKRLVVGPWPHSTGRSECGAAAFGQPAAMDQRELAVEWFDRWLKGGAGKADSGGRVRYFRMGGGDGAAAGAGLVNVAGSWQTTTSFPPPGVGKRSFYLHTPGSLSTSSPSKAAPSRYRHTAADPVPTRGGRYGVGNSPMCPQDQRPLDSRSDVLRFSGAPLAESLDVTGRVEVRLWVSASASSADFTARLVDVYPSGLAMLVADGQRRASLKPGRPLEISIDLGYISILFTPGHRLRVDISSSNFPKYETNPLDAEITLFHDAGHPSRIELPVAAGTN
jgi:hypothetical protein